MTEPHELLGVPPGDISFVKSRIVRWISRRMYDKEVRRMANMCVEYQEELRKRERNA